MTDNTLKREGRINRRKFVGGVGTGIAVGMAGCTGDGDGDDGGDGTPTGTEGEDGTPTDTPSGDEITEGGTPIEGMDTAPDVLNILSTSTAYAFEVLDRIYETGTAIHPESQELIPWAYRDWEVNPGNVGTDNPTLVGHLREDMVWNDGEPVTAEDVIFTVNYVTEQEAAGTIAASQFASVEDMGMPNEHTVNYFLSERNSAWATEILGNYILPQHVWSNVDDYTTYTPRNSDEGIVGSGPMVLQDFSWENWFDLTWRDDEDAIWQPGADYVDWIHEDAPFTDGWRIEVFGSQTALQQAVLDGDVDVSYGTFQVDRAVQATEEDHLEVIESDDDGWGHHSFNMRRVPLDDPAFRQFLVLMMDSEWIIEDLKQGIGSVEGTYATPKAYGEWRPPEPSEQEEFEGIPTPNLDFPGEAGSFNIGEEGIQAARDFLANHGQASHDYSWQEASAPAVASPDGMVLHVNGDPLHQAHTDNDGNPGQGPLEMSFNPPQEDLDESRIAQTWIGALKTVGVPVEPAIQSFNSQIPKVYGSENFDMYAMGWTDIGVLNDHYQQLFGSPGADLDGTSDALLFNPMAYTGADDLIQEQRQIMEVEPRKPIVKQILARIWADAPTDVTHHPNVLQPVNTDWEGWVQEVGGVVNVSSTLNLRQSG